MNGTELLAMIDKIHWLNLLALAWFCICLQGYSLYSRVKSGTTPCLVNVLHLYRVDWMRRLLKRDMRIADIATIANLERSVAFFASTTLILLAGLLTLFSASEHAIELISASSLVVETTLIEWELKLLVMVALFIYAFFKFTWSLRQYGFASVLIGSAPVLDGNVADGEDQKHDATEAECEAFVQRAAQMETIAANNFNMGLRIYYFSLALLGWIVSPWLLIGMSSVVVYVLYQREFRSITLRTLMAGQPEGHLFDARTPKLIK
ncbi:MAG: DUF599 family protein [Motiliproteus sp.]